MSVMRTNVRNLRKAIKAASIIYVTVLFSRDDTMYLAVNKSQLLNALKGMPGTEPCGFLLREDGALYVDGAHQNINL